MTIWTKTSYVYTLSTAKYFLNYSHRNKKYLIADLSLNHWKRIMATTAFVLNISATLKSVSNAFKLASLLYNTVLIKMPYYSRIILNSFYSRLFPKLFQHNRHLPYSTNCVILLLRLSLYHYPPHPRTLTTHPLYTLA